MGAEGDNAAPSHRPADDRLWQWGGQSQSALVAARVIAAFGLPLTGVWLYAGHRHLQYSRALQRHAASQLPDYADTRAACHQPGLGATSLIVYGLPSLAAGMWLTLLLVS